MQGILTALGKDCLLFIDEHEFPLPQEYRFLQLPGLVSEPPADLEQRTIVFLDCGNLDRNPGRGVPPRPASTSSTSTTITTTRASAPSTTSTTTRRAPPRSSGI